MLQLWTPQSPLDFPRRKPGFNSAHPFFANVQTYQHLSLVPISGHAAFVDTFSVKKTTITAFTNHVAAKIIDPIGPTVFWSTRLNSDVLNFTGTTLLPVNNSVAAILQFNAVAAAQNIFLNGAGGAAGFNFSINASSQLLLTSGGTNANSTFTLSANVPYFVGAFSDGSKVTFLAIRLDTGQVFTTIGVATASPTSNPGTWIIGNAATGNPALNGYLAALAFTSRELDNAEVLQISLDPWSIWYPPGIEQLIKLAMKPGPTDVLMPQAQL